MTDSISLKDFQKMLDFKTDVQQVADNTGLSVNILKRYRAAVQGKPFSMAFQLGILKSLEENGVFFPFGSVFIVIPDKQFEDQLKNKFLLKRYMVNIAPENEEPMQVYIRENTVLYCSFKTAIRINEIYGRKYLLVLQQTAQDEIPCYDDFYPYKKILYILKDREYMEKKICPLCGGEMSEMEKYFYLLAKSLFSVKLKIKSCKCCQADFISCKIGDKGYLSKKGYFLENYKLMSFHDFRKEKKKTKNNNSGAPPKKKEKIPAENKKPVKKPGAQIDLQLSEKNVSKSLLEEKETDMINREIVKDIPQNKTLTSQEVHAKRSYCPVKDHLGNIYPTTTAMCKHYGIRKDVYMRKKKRRTAKRSLDVPRKV